jgi:acetyl esterase/lipase
VTLLKLSVLARCLVFVCFVSTAAAKADSKAVARGPAWQPSAGNKQVPLWPGTPPDSHPPTKPEATETSGSIAGSPMTSVTDVSRPTLTVYSPKGKNTGAAVIVFPGGGYQILAIDLEGTEVCDWLTAKGITCVVLKYHVPHSGPDWNQRCGCYNSTKSSMALVDAQRTLGLVRFHAAEWHIDPHKIGVLGFSAGGHLVAAVSTHFEKRLYPAVDVADKVSCRPDFAIALYPGHIWTYDDSKLQLNPEIHFTRQTPPTFSASRER